MMARELLVVLVAEVDDWHSCGHVICYDCYVHDLVTLTEHYDHRSWYCAASRSVSSKRRSSRYVVRKH